MSGVKTAQISQNCIWKKKNQCTFFLFLILCHKIDEHHSTQAARAQQQRLSCVCVCVQVRPLTVSSSSSSIYVTCLWSRCSTWLQPRWRTQSGHKWKRVSQFSAGLWCDVMYELQPRCRRYLNDMIYENGSLAELEGPEEGDWSESSQDATRNYRIVVARARSHAHGQSGERERGRVHCSDFWVSCC